MKLQNLIITVFALALLAASPAMADERFFSSMPDVPLKKGLQELPQFNITFDKPQGRITESLAAIRYGKPEDIKAFYAQTLPQLGWRALGEASYQRGDEVLELRFEVEDDSPYLRVMIRPS